MLKIGDEVYLSDEGIKRWRGYGAESSNPISTKGVVADIEIVNGVIDDLGFFVEWNNGYCNSYDEENLIKVTQEKPVVIGYKRMHPKGLYGSITLSKWQLDALCELHGKFGKQKFRPVYEVQNELE